MLTTFRARVFSRPFRLVGALAAVVAVLGLSLVIPPSSSVPVVRTADSAPVPSRQPTPLTDGKGKKYPNAKVTVSQTTNIQQRQVIRVSWTGFEPSRNYYTAPPANGDNTEFPVVLLECWGKDTAQTPMDPTHCQRIRSSVMDAPIPSQSNIQIFDVANDPAYPNPNPPDVIASPNGNPRLGFTAVDGKHYGPGDLPVGLNGNGVVPDNAVMTYSDRNGSRSNVEFEVRGGQDAPVLGCSDQKACTLEVVPILQPYCKPGFKGFYADDCPAGSGAPRGKPFPIPPPYSNDPNNRNEFLIGGNWWLGTEWKNRFAFELNMAPLANECGVVDQRPTLTMDGSEAPTPVMASWEQPFCIDPKNHQFKVSHSFGLTEDLARRSLVTQGPAGYDSNGIFTSFPVTGSPRPLVHAPVAVTGWTLAYKIDDYSRNEYRNLTLSPLLLAKLITSSYSWSSQDPAVAGNPSSMYKDPEFKALNPGFTPTGAIGDGGSVMWDQLSSDAFAAMFAYIDADPEARAWLDGKPDAYSGMVVNTNFRGKLKPPQTLVQYLDGWVKYDPCTGFYCDPPAQCRHLDPQPFWGFEQNLNKTSLEATAKAVLSRSPQAMACKQYIDGNPNAYHWAKGDGIGPIGQRDLLAFTTVALAERYGLSLAKLQSHTPNSRPVAPSGWENLTNNASQYDTLGTALGYTKQDPATGVVSPDFGVFPFNNAYAGVLPVYAAIPTCGLDPTLAGQYADFLNFAAGAGQTPGTGAGQLPWGYSPLPKPYADYTKTAAQAVRDQKCEVPPPPQDLSQQVRNDAGLPPPRTPDDQFANQLATRAPTGQVPPGAGNPNTTGNAAPGGGKSLPSSVAGRPAPAAVATSATDSWLDAWGLVILLVVGLVAGLAVPVVRVAGEPGHPARQAFAGLGHRLAATFRRKST